MTKVYKRTENDVVTHVSTADGMSEVNTAMAGGFSIFKQMSSEYGRHYIEYNDGRRVLLILEEAPESNMEGQKVVTVLGKTYVVEPAPHAEHYLHYYTERDGKAFGATRFASASRKPGTVGRAIWDAIKG